MDYKNIVDNIEEYGLKLENKTGFIEIKEIKKEFNEKLNSNSNINKQKLNCRLCILCQFPSPCMLSYPSIIAVQLTSVSSKRRAVKRRASAIHRQRNVVSENCPYIIRQADNHCHTAAAAATIIAFSDQ